MAPHLEAGSKKLPVHFCFPVGTLARIFVEPAAAKSVAAVRKLRESGVSDADDVVICNLTGHGPKQPDAIRLRAEELRPIPPTL
jgi:threonine synthase